MRLWSELELVPGLRAGIGHAGHRTNGPKQREASLAGFTLAEVLVSVFLVAIIGGAFYAALSSGFLQVQVTRDDLRATQILMQRLEAVRLCTWTELSNFSFQEAYDPMASTNQTTGTQFFGNVALAPSPGIPNSSSYAPNVRLVTVSVSWTNYNGKIPIGHNRQMQTQVARYGLQNYVWGAIQ